MFKGLWFLVHGGLMETPHLERETPHLERETPHLERETCLLYTSDAADDANVV